MRNQLIALAPLAFAIILFLSCSDHPVLKLPSEDEVYSSFSSSGTSSSNSETTASSSSSESSSSSSSSEKIDSSSSSGEVASSSSSSEEVSSSSQCDNKCNEQCYDKETQGCCKNSGNNTYNIYPLKRRHYGEDKEQFCDERDGKTYVYVNIGTGATAQTWMAENLNYKTSDGTSRCYPTSGTTNTSDDDNTNCTNSDGTTKYGRLYDWETAIKVCPTGWHTAKRDEWIALAIAADGTGPDGDGGIAATKLKAMRDWNTTSDGYIAGTDDFGFSALPGSLRNASGNFSGVGDSGFWWTATEREDDTSEAYRRNMHYAYAILGNNYIKKSSLLSVRCVQNKEN